MKIRHRYAGLDYTEIAKFMVNFKEVFSMKYIYFILHEWLVEEGWAPKKDDKFPEVYYLQKENPAIGKEIWIRWRLEKAVAGTTFWKFKMDIDIHVLGLTDAEVMIKDKKVKLNKGEIEFQVATGLIHDAAQEWKKNEWLKPFKELYYKRLIRQKHDELKRQVFNDTYKLQGFIKTYLKLENYFPEKEGEVFWNKRTGE